MADRERVADKAGVGDGARLGTRIVAAAIAGMALAGAAPAVASPPRGDGDDSAGPLDIAKVQLEQRASSMVLEVRTHESLPALRALHRWPARVGAEGEPYLCVAIAGPKLGRKLLCPGGKATRGRVEVGRSTYGAQGWATARGSFEARIADRGARELALRFSLDEAGIVPGRVRWRALSGWAGPRCATARPASPCRDRAPNNRFSAARIFKLRVTGCSRAGGIFRTGPSREKRVALTFDDGPSSYTRAVIDILDRHGAKGTFFVVGSQVSGRSGLLREALEHGHEIGNHSMSHGLLPGYSDLRATSARIEDATGFRPCTFRPPYGALNSGVVGAAASLGMSTILWDVDTHDWTTPGSGAIYSSAVDAGRGSIVLMHDGGGHRGQTVAALPGIVKDLRSRGYRLVTVTKLLGERFRREEDR